MEHRFEKKVTPIQESKKNTFEDASAEFFIGRMQEVKTSYIDELSPFSKEISQEIGGRLQDEYDAKCVELGNDFLKNTRNVKNANISVEDVANLFKGNQEFNEMVKNNEDLGRLMIQIEAVQKPGGKLSLLERIILHEKFVGTEEDLKDPEKRELAVKTHEAITGENLGIEAMEKMKITKEENEKAWVLNRLGVKEITPDDIKSANKERKNDENWGKLTEKEKEKILYNEKLDNIKESLKGVIGKELSNAELIALNEHLQNTIGFSLEDIKFEEKENKKSKNLFQKPKKEILFEIEDKKGTVKFEGKPKDLFVFSSNDAEKIQNEIDEVNEEWEKDLIKKENEMMLKRKEKNADFIGLAYQSMINEKYESFEEKIGGENIFERSENAEMKDGNQLSELLENIFENPSMKEGLEVFLKALKQSGFLEVFGFLKTESKEEKEELKEDEKKQEESSEEIKEKVKEGFAKKEIKGFFTSLAIFLMIIFAIMEKQFDSFKKRK